MRLRTAVAEESASRYTIPTPTTRQTAEEREEVRPQHAPTTAQSAKARAHPKRLALISGCFLLALGALHALSAHQAATMPVSHQTLKSRAESPSTSKLHKPGPLAYIMAANNLVDRSVFNNVHEETLVQKRQVLAENELVLSLTYKAVGKPLGTQRDNPYLTREYTSTTTGMYLLVRDYQVARADGRREQMLKALLGMMRLEQLELRTTRSPEYFRFADALWMRLLREDRFTVSEAQAIAAERAVLLKAEPDWEALANERESLALDTLRAIVTGEPMPRVYTDVATRPLNWDTLATGKALEQAGDNLMRQKAILTYGTQGVVDAYTPYIQALRERALAETPGKAQAISLPIVPELPHQDELNEGFKRLQEARERLAEGKAAIQKLPLQIEGH